MTEKRQRVKMVTDLPCAKCGETLPAGITAYYLPGTSTWEHYGKCKGVQKKEYQEAAMKQLGLDEKTIASIGNLVQYLYRDELKDFESREEGEAHDGHIFNDVERVKKFLEGIA